MTEYNEDGYKYAPLPTDVELWDKVRAGRNWVLETFVDWYQSKPLVFNTLTAAKQTELAVYRQALLDFPEDLETYLDGDKPLGYGKYYPVQPTFFSNHPIGRIHTPQTQTRIVAS